MDRNTFAEFLNEKNIFLTKEEIEEVLNEELVKSENEMDTDLVDKCVELLEQINSGAAKPEQNSKKHKKTVNIKRILLVAAIVALLCTLSLSVSANLFNFDIPKEFVKFYKDYVAIDLGKGEPTTAAEHVSYSTVDEEYKKNGFSDVVLPSLMRESNIVVTEVKSETSDISYVCRVEFKNDKYNSLNYMTVTKYNSADLFTTPNVMNPDSGKYLMVNGIKVFVFEQNEHCLIIYGVLTSEYLICLNCGFDEAVEIAKTIS